jgi:hypothetical protein
MSRSVALIVVLAAHVGLIVVFSVSRKLHREIPEEERSMTVVFVSRIPAGEPVSRSHLESEVNRRREGKVSKRAASFTRPTPLESAAIAPQLSEVEESSGPASVDWSKEAELAASRQIDSLENARRRSRGFTPLEANREPRKAPMSKPEFGWSHARTHRIEPLPEGGTLVWINERCALVVNGGLLPFCKLGKIETRGDLFEHMRDAREPGKWK